MKAFFDYTTEEFRGFIPGMVANFTIKQALKNVLEQTAEALLFPFLGEDLAQLISESYDSEDEDLKKAYGLARFSIAKIGFADYLPFAEVQIGDDGVTVTSVAERKAAYEYQTLKLDKELREKGWQKLDDLLKFIGSKPDSFPGWTDSPYYQQHQEALFKSASEFSKYYPIQDRWLTFWALRPAIQAVEDNKGVDQLERIDALPDTVSDSQKAVLRRNLMRALAYEAVLLALPNLAVELNGTNVQVNYAGQFGNSSYYTPPGREMLDWVSGNLQKQIDVFWLSFENGLSALLPSTDTNADSLGLIETDGPFVFI